MIKYQKNYCSHMASWIWVNISSGNGLLPDGTKPLPDPMLTYHQWGLTTFLWGQFHNRCLHHQSLKLDWEITYKKFHLNAPWSYELSDNRTRTWRKSWDSIFHYFWEWVTVRVCNVLFHSNLSGYRCVLDITLSLYAKSFYHDLAHLPIQAKLSMI